MAMMSYKTKNNRILKEKLLDSTPFLNSRAKAIRKPLYTISKKKTNKFNICISRQKEIHETARPKERLQSDSIQKETNNMHIKHSAHARRIRRERDRDKRDGCCHAGWTGSRRRRI